MVFFLLQKRSSLIARERQNTSSTNKSVILLLSLAVLAATLIVCVSFPDCGRASDLGLPSLDREPCLSLSLSYSIEQEYNRNECAQCSASAAQASWSIIVQTSDPHFRHLFPRLGSDILSCCDWLQGIGRSCGLYHSSTLGCLRLIDVHDGSPLLQSSCQTIPEENHLLLRIESDHSDERLPWYNHKIRWFVYFGIKNNLDTNIPHWERNGEFD